MPSKRAPVPAELVRRVEAALGIPFVITFAQTESSCSITVTRPGDAPGDRAETVGRPLPQTEVKIIDPRTGVTLAPGTTGEICTRGYLVMPGYLGDPRPPARRSTATAGFTPATSARWTSVA